MTDERYLRHVTVDTGHERRSPLSEVDPDIMEQLKALLTESIKFGKPMHVGAGFWVLAVLEKATSAEVVGALGDLERCLAWSWLYYF